MPYADDDLVKNWKLKSEPKVPLVTSVTHSNDKGHVMHSITHGSKVLGLNSTLVSDDVIKKKIAIAEEKIGHKILFVQGPAKTNR